MCFHRNWLENIFVNIFLKIFKTLSFLVHSKKNKPCTFLKAKNETKIQLPRWVKSWLLKPQCGSLAQIPVWTRWGKNLNPGFFQSHWNQHWLGIGAKQRPFAFCLVCSITILKIFYVLVSIKKKTHFPAYRTLLPGSDHCCFSCCSQFLQWTGAHRQ